MALQTDGGAEMPEYCSSARSTQGTYIAGFAHPRVYLADCAFISPRCLIFALALRNLKASNVLSAPFPIRADSRRSWRSWSDEAVALWWMYHRLDRIVACSVGDRKRKLWPATEVELGAEQTAVTMESDGCATLLQARLLMMTLS